MISELTTTTLVEWSRWQFAMTAIYHYMFVPLTLGLSFLLAIMETMWVRTGKAEWLNATKFWMKLFAINFAIGIATGLILEFQFGSNWSNYSWFVGDIFGAPLAIEGLFAFFLEATFFAVMFFGWNRVSRRFHLVSTWMVFIGSNISALWILVANAWMQNPVGMEFNPMTARNEMSDFWAVLLSPTAMSKFFHTVTSALYAFGLFCRWSKRLVYSEKKTFRICPEEYPAGLRFRLPEYHRYDLHGRHQCPGCYPYPTDETSCYGGTQRRRERSPVYLDRLDLHRSSITVRTYENGKIRYYHS